MMNIGISHHKKKGIAKSKKFEFDKNLALVLDSIGDGIIVVDIDSKIVQVNKMFEKITGFSSTEVINRHVEDVWVLKNSYDDKTKQNPLFIAMTQEDMLGLSRNTYLVAKDGSKKFISASCSPIRDKSNKVEGAIAVFRDITRIIKAETELVKERSNLDRILDAAPVGIMIVDKNYEIKRVNKDLVSILRFDEAEILNKKLGDGIKCINSLEEGCCKSLACSKCMLKNSISSVLEHGIPINDVEMFHSMYGDNSRNGIWLNMSAVDVNLDDENQVILVIEDVTNKKIMLEELELSKNEAEAASIAKSEFLANMSHEIRTPLNGVLGMVDLTLLSNLKKDQKENLEIAKTCAESLLKVINDILDFSKIEAGKIIIESVGFDINQLISKLIKSFSKQAEQKGISIEMHIEEGINSNLIGDPDRLKQVLINLIGNAIKFTDFGKVKIIVKKVLATSSLCTLKFSVVDTGIGIAKIDIDKLFKSFSQVDGSYTRKFGGTGLGLAICKQLVEMMDGQISVESVIGEGSTFSFTSNFYYGDNFVENLPARTNNILKVNEQLNILVAEDDLLNQVVIINMLAKLGHKATIANDGAETIELYKSNDYDIVFMDIQMPKMDGIEATYKIKEFQKNTGKYIPIIALTAYALTGDREKFLNAGMDEYLSKPFQLSEISEIIAKVLSSKDNKHKLLKNNFSDITYEDLKNNSLVVNKEDIVKQLNFLKLSISENKLNLVEKYAHLVKDLCDNEKFKKVKNIAFKIEMAARKDEFNLVMQMLIQLEEELGKV